MPLSEHVYCVVTAFQVAEWAEQGICIEFCIKLEHSSEETIWMIQKAAAMDKGWLAALSLQYTCSYIISAEIFGKTSSPPGDSTLYSPELVPCDFCLFPKLRSPLKGKRFQTVDEIQENTMGQLMTIGRTVWGPRVSTLKKTEVLLSYVQRFLYLLSSSINISIFHITWLDAFWTDFA